MDGYSISQVAARTGFAPSTLRYYEQSGLVAPARTAAGYRSYDERHVELLEFIGRAKAFGLTLDEITEVLHLLDDERCEPVQQRLQALVAAKIDDAQRRIADLVAFTAELQRVAAGLARHTPDGPCDEACGCRTDAVPQAQPLGVALSDGPEVDGSPPIACTLDSAAAVDRVRDWQRLLAPAVRRGRLEAGVRVVFPPGTDPAPIASLAAAEQRCCAFFSFGLVIDTDGVALEVTGPPDARPVIDALVGPAA